MSVKTGPAPLDLSDLDACAAELRYLRTVLTLACAAKSIHQSGREVTLAALADRCEQPVRASALEDVAPQLREVLGLPRPAALAPMPETLRAIARDGAFGPRVDAALADVDYGNEQFAIEIGDSLVAVRETIFDRLAALLVDAPRA